MINFGRLQSKLIERITPCCEIMQKSTKVWKSTKLLLGRARRNLAVKKERNKKKKNQFFSYLSNNQKLNVSLPLR